MDEWGILVRFVGLSLIKDLLVLILLILVNFLARQ